MSAIKKTAEQPRPGSLAHGSIGILRVYFRRVQYRIFLLMLKRQSLREALICALTAELRSREPEWGRPFMAGFRPRKTDVIDIESEVVS
jgi:hypothetical protein